MTILELKKINFSIFLLSLLPLAFVVGPLIVEIIINTLILIFLYNCIKNNNLYFFYNKIFIFFLFFYLYLIFNLIFSDFFDESALNVFSYIRFILFPFAIFDILKKNENNFKFLFLTFLFTIFIVVLDGYYQFIFEKNLLGFEKYRVDRISGFFKDDLILGSFLSRMLPLFIGLTLFFNEKLKLSKLNMFILFLTFVLTFVLIFLTGERASFFLALLALLLILILIRSYFYLRIIFLFISILSIATLIISNPVMSDRYFKQLKYHIAGVENTNNILPYYMPMFKTSLKMFDENKLLGMGPKSYRYLCDDKRFITYFPSTIIVDNTIVKVKQSWKERRNLYLKNFLVNEGDFIKKNDQIFSYTFDKEKEVYFYLSDKEGKIEKIYKKNFYFDNNVVLDITPQTSPKKEYLKQNACSTHPHNIYIQILAEIGLLGFIFIFCLFVYILYLLLKIFFYKFLKKKILFSDSTICILVGFFVILFPLTTNGNFFNNWINLISFYPFGFFLYLFNKDLKK